MPQVTTGVVAVSTPTYRDTWDANWVMAGPDAGPEAVFTALERHFAGGWQVVHVDCLTAPAVEAALALAGFTAEGTLIEMRARAVIATRPPPAFDMRRVGAPEWERFAQLVGIDQREGRRTGEHDGAVGAGLLDGMRRRLDLCDFWLLTQNGMDLGYGMTAACPNGLGLIESLFTLPEHRGRGLMSGFIVHAAAALKAQGCDAAFLDAHAHDTPKRLYARLGFAPVALTRTWVRDSSPLQRKD